jgi:hypothetical protein
MTALERIRQPERMAEFGHVPSEPLTAVALSRHGASYSPGECRVGAGAIGFSVDVR